MALDIRGSLKNTRIKQDHFVVIDELLSNAVDSFIIRRNTESIDNDLKVSFFIEFSETASNLKITCSDNGFGFRNEQVKAFITKDTSYKDDLKIEGIGKCRGTGRIQFLHYFSKLTINSIYKTEKGLTQRKLYIDENTQEINEKSFNANITTTGKIETSISLDNLRPEIYETLLVGKNLEAEFSADSLKYHVMTSFLQLFVSLKKSLGNFSITFKTKKNDNINEEKLTPNDLPKTTETKELEILPKKTDSLKAVIPQKFVISHYKLDKNKFKLKKNVVALCAKSAIVKTITKKYLKLTTIENNDIKGYYHIVLIESDYLDEYVNQHRDNFTIPKNSCTSDMFFQNKIYLEDIYDEIDGIVHEMLDPPDWGKEKIIENLEIKYGISASMIIDANIRIHYGDTEDGVVERVLTSYQKKIIKDTSDIFDIKEEISQVEPDSEDFRKKVNELSWKYTSSLKNIDMANLSQVVVRRSAILEILNLATKKDLKVQTERNGERRKNEKLIHNIFFPMGKDSHECSDHDMWLLSEDYHYYDYIASDKALSQLRWNDDSLLFDEDIDDELEVILSFPH